MTKRRGDGKIGGREKDRREIEREEGEEDRLKKVEEIGDSTHTLFVSVCLSSPLHTIYLCIYLSIYLYVFVYTYVL